MAERGGHCGVTYITLRQKQLGKYRNFVVGLRSWRVLCNQGKNQFGMQRRKPTIPLSITGSKPLSAVQQGVYT